MSVATLKRVGGCLPVHRWIRPDGSPVVVVLMYHDLCRDNDFANWLRVPTSVFAAQLDALARVGEFVDPVLLANPQRLPRDRLSFVVTFDDGYLNNALLAAPILAQRRIPALYFISTGPMLSQQPFWTDVVVTPIQALALKQIDLSAHGLGVFHFRGGDQAGRWDDIQRLLVAIKAEGNEDDPRIADILAWFRRNFHEVLAEHLPRFRPLMPDEVARMAGSDLCRLGSHGHEHRIMTRLTDADLEHSLVQSGVVLREIARAPIVELAYPNGERDARVEAAAALAGYQRGYIVRPSLVAGRGAALAIPRLAVGAFDSPATLRFRIYKLLMAWHFRGRTREWELL